MLDRLWHLRGSVAIDRNVSDNAVMLGIEDLLRKQWRPISRKGIGFVEFDRPLWSLSYSGPNWLAMILYDKGSFRMEPGVDGRRLVYDLRSLHGFLFCLLGGFVFAIFRLATGGNLESALMLGVGTFAWLYGVNMLLAWLRVPQAIRKVVEQL